MSGHVVFSHSFLSLENVIFHHLKQLKPEKFLAAQANFFIYITSHLHQLHKLNLDNVHTLHLTI